MKYGICICCVISSVSVSRGESVTQFTDFFYGVSPSPKITFLHISDTHILWADEPQQAADCQPSGPSLDGRTDCKDAIALYDDLGMWLDPVSNQSNAPIVALESFVEYANEQSPDFVVITGDIISNASGCDADTEASYQKFAEIMEDLTVPWYAVNGDLHDTCDGCFDLFEEYVGNPAWHFTIGGNLFVGVPEITHGSFDVSFLNRILAKFATSQWTAFIFAHSGMECHNGATHNFRCGFDDDFAASVRSYTPYYRAMVILSGHNHANIYDDTDAENNLHHFSTSALMNYPTQARMVRVHKTFLRFTMSPSVNLAIDELSVNIIRGAGRRDEQLFHGSFYDRHQNIRINYRLLPSPPEAWRSSP